LARGGEFLDGGRCTIISKKKAGIESQVVMRFYILCVLCAVVALKHAEIRMNEMQNAACHWTKITYKLWQEPLRTPKVLWGG